MFIRVLADADSSLQYYAEVGVNSFVTMQLSFLPDSEVRSTRVAARSFCPEFEHHTEFSCNLLVQRDSGESVSLAELMQDAVAIFTIYNRDTRKSECTTFLCCFVLFNNFKVMVAFVKIPQFIL